MIEDAVRAYAAFEDRTTDPSTPSAGEGLVYFKDGALHSIDDAGTVVEYGAGGGGATAELLDWHQVARASSGGTSIGTSFTTVAENSVTLEVTPTVPSSGQLRVVFAHKTASAGSYVRLHDGTAEIADTNQLASPTSSSVNGTLLWYLTGLTADATQTIQVQIRASSGTLNLYSGPGTGTSDHGPMTLEAWAA